MIRRPPKSTQSRSSAASDVYKRQVHAFIGPYRATNPILDTKHPVTVGPFDGLHGWYFEHKVAQNRAMDRALKVIQDVADEYAEISGRHYGLLDPYRLEDACLL